MKKITSVILIVVLMVSSLVMASANQKVRVEVNGRSVDFGNVSAFVDEYNRTQVPIKFIAEELGAKVDWNSSKRLVTINDDKQKIELIIGEKQATVNGQVRKFDSKAMIVNSRTFVPLKFVSTILGAKVEWIAKDNLVKITTGVGGVEVGEEIEVNQYGEIKDRSITLALEKEYLDSIKVSGTKISGRLPKAPKGFVMKGNIYLEFKDGTTRGLAGTDVRAINRMIEGEKFTFDMGIDISKLSEITSRVSVANKENGMTNGGSVIRYKANKITELEW